MIYNNHLPGETVEDSTTSDDANDGTMPRTELVVGAGCVSAGVVPEGNSELELTVSLEGSAVLNTTRESEIF